MTTVPAVINFMAARTKLAPGDYTGDRRGRRYAFPRMIAMWLCVELMPKASLPQLGRGFNRDRTTIIHARDQMEALRYRNAEVRHLTDHLKAELVALERPAEFTHVTRTGRPLMVVA